MFSARLLAVLQAVAEHPQGVGLPDLAAKLGLPRQTVHRVLGQLRDSGLLLRDPVRERFSVGPRLIQLSLSALGFEQSVGAGAGGAAGAGR